MKKDELRYSRLCDIIQIVFRMWAKRTGITLDDMAYELNSTRRTAERVRDAILRIFPQIGELESKNTSKKFGFLHHDQRALITGLVSFTDEELIELEKILKQAERDKDEDRVSLVKSLINKILVLKTNLVNKEDMEHENFRLLMQSEGYVTSQFSKQIVDIKILFDIREALKMNCQLIFSYTKRGGESAERNVEPYGILYNHKNYLVAKDHGVMKLFDLARINNIKIGEKFILDQSFNLKEFSERSFGVYQEDPIEVVLLFSEYASFDAKNYHFHPSQELIQRESGELEVKFKAGAVNSIIWELFKWGTGVQILSPSSLRDAYIEELQNVLNIQKYN